jgi:hypothetical protein
MNKCGLITAGVFACIAAVTAVIAGGILVAVDAADLELCYDDYYYDDYYYDSGYSWWSCALMVRGILQLIGATLMIGSAVCTFVFACGPRYNKHHDQVDSGYEDHRVPHVADVVVLEVMSPHPKSSKASSNNGQNNI